MVILNIFLFVHQYCFLPNLMSLPYGTYKNWSFTSFTFLQALASERELVLALLDPDAVVDTGPTARRFSKGLEGDLGKTETDLAFVLDRIFEGVCRPFKVRVEQVLQSQPNIIVSYKLSNTLEFYSHTVS